MSFLDEVKNVAMTDDKQNVILEKIAIIKDKLLNSFADDIYGGVKKQIKDLAALGKFNNNIITGEVGHVACCRTWLDDDLTKLPLTELNKYINGDRGKSAFVVHNKRSIGYEPILALRLLENTVVDGFESYQKKVGLIFKREKTFRVKEQFCEIYSDETKKVVDIVKRYAHTDNIVINDVFFRVTFLAHMPENYESYAYSQEFVSDINIDNPRIRIDRSKVRGTPDQITIQHYTDDPSTVFFNKQPRIVVKFSMAI